MSIHQRLSLVFVLLLMAIVVMDIVSGINWLWYVLLALLYLLACAFGSFVMSLQFYMPSRCRGTNEEKAIALTFDDGPIPGETEKILEILRQHDVRAAFFCIGRRVTDNVELVGKIDSEGHIIGNHSFYHKPSFGFQSQDSVGKELEMTDDAVEKILGKRPRFFRPPFGVTSPMIARAAAKNKSLTIGWSIRSFDTIINDTGRLYDRVTQRLQPGDIILFHDYSKSMISVLPAFLMHVRERGFKIVRLDELLNEKPYR